LSFCVAQEVENGALAVIAVAGVTLLTGGFDVAAAAEGAEVEDEVEEIKEVQEELDELLRLPPKQTA